MILNQTQKQPIGVELFCINSVLKIYVKVLEKKIFSLKFIFSTVMH